MKINHFLTIYFSLFTILIVSAQVRNEYVVSFDNAEHHEATIEAKFTNLNNGNITLRMSRTSPGRYALHEFVKNVYDVKITDSKGKDVTIKRPNPHQWDVSGHDGTINFSYKLFADRGDGTYSQIDQTHALLNIPATFIYVPTLEDRPVQVKFNVREDLQWRVSTQMEALGENVFLAKDLDNFMDSPVLISNHTIKEYTTESGNKDYTIRLALQHEDGEDEADRYFEKIKKIVAEQKAIFGDLPNFDNDTYTFLASYMPQVSGDGMEHRNSSVLTSTKALSKGGQDKNIGTVAHEFFHSWNVERIRPRSLEPFDYQNANMSGALWFAEGFTSYYGELTLLRAGLITFEEYLSKLTETYNYVWDSPALNYKNPIEMSYMAPLIDANKPVDPINRKNTFISYYSYGAILGLALDLSLREKDGLSLDDFMKLLWSKYGKTEIPYTLENLYLTLREYAGNSIADNFFENYIYQSNIPDYKKLLGNVGVFPKTDSKTPYLGIEIGFNENDQAIISEYVKKGTPAYEAGLVKGDVIIAIDNQSFSDLDQFAEVLSKYKPGKKILVVYNRFGEEYKKYIKLTTHPKVELIEFSKPNKKALENRAQWIESKG